jgi:hypothetical protein
MICPHTKAGTSIRDHCGVEGPPCLPLYHSDPSCARETGPLDDTINDLRPYLDTIPDPRSPRGRWYSLACILLICACVAVSGAKSIEELAEWGQRTHDAVLGAIGVRPHPLSWRHPPSTPAIDRVLIHIDGDALDTAIGAYLADWHHTATSHNDLPATPARRDRRGRQSVEGDRRALISRAVTCSRRSPTTSASPSPKPKLAPRQARPATSALFSKGWTWPGAWSASTRSAPSRTTCPGWSRPKTPTTSR